MFVDVETFFFDTCRNAKPVNLVEYLENNESHTCRPDSDNNRTEKLGTQKASSMSVEQPFTGREQTGEHCSQETTNPVYGRSTDRIVNLQYLVNKVDCKYHDYTTNGTD